MDVNGSSDYLILGINGPIFAVAVSIELILAFIPNLFIVAYSMYHYKILKQPSMIFLTGLAVVNLLMPTLFLPFTVIAAAAGEWIFGKTDEQRDGVCDFVGFIFSFAVSLTFYMLALISVDRLVLLVKPMFYKKYIKSYVALILVGIVWLIAVIKNISPFAGLGEIVFGQQVASCIPNWDNTEYVVYYSVLTLIPVLVIIVASVWTFCYSCKFVTRISSGETENVYSKKVCNLIGLFGMLLIIMIASIVPFVLAAVAIGFFGLENVPAPVYAATFIVYFFSNIGFAVVQLYFRGDIRETIRHGMSRMKNIFTHPQPDMDHTIISQAPSADSLNCDMEL